MYVGRCALPNGGIDRLPRTSASRTPSECGWPGASPAPRDPKRQIKKRESGKPRSLLFFFLVGHVLQSLYYRLVSRENGFKLIAHNSQKLSNLASRSLMASLLVDLALSICDVKPRTPRSLSLSLYLCLSLSLPLSLSSL